MINEMRIYCCREFEIHEIIQHIRFDQSHNSRRLLSITPFTLIRNINRLVANLQNINTHTVSTYIDDDDPGDVLMILLPQLRRTKIKFNYLYNR